jgi:hypothetical protein
MDGLLERVQMQITQTEDALESKLDHAANLPDGTKIFKDKSGDVRSQDGALVAAELAATVLWRGDEPSYEDMQADTERLARLNDLAGDIRSGQAEIGDMQAAMADESEVESSDELEGFKDRADEIVEEAEERFEAEITSTVEEDRAFKSQPVSEIVVPRL